MNHKRLAAALFLSFFSAQASFVVLAPVLPELAREFGISVAQAGQLRTAAAVGGAVVAIALTPFARRIGIRRVLITGLAALAVGSFMSATAPTFAALAVAQIVVGGGLAGVLSGGLAAAMEWPDPGRRATVLAWTTIGQPASWVAALPLVGVLSGIDWRWSCLVVPLVALTAWLILPRRTPARDTSACIDCTAQRLIRDPQIARWAFGELMAFAGWGGTLVFAGALLEESYGLSTAAVGLLLAGAATAYFPGTFAARSRLEGDLRLLLGRLALALAGSVALFGLVRPTPAVSTALFGVAILAAGARGIVGSAFGMHAAPGQKLAIGSIRSAATQLGYLLGAAGGGLALEVGGYGGLGIALAGFFVLAAAPHLARMRQPLARFAESTTTSDS
jgi:predicted MFS family arabinose efflux permease